MKRETLFAGYFHLETLLVKEGQSVEAGQPIGLVGHNPRVSDPRHLHFEMQRVARPKYRPINPRPYLLKASHTPIDNGLVWPIPPLSKSGDIVDGVVMDGRAPGVSSSGHWDNPSRPSHKGVDIMFPREPGDTQKSGDGAGAKRWVMPRGMLAVSLGPGTVVETGRIPTGLRCWVRVEFAGRKDSSLIAPAALVAGVAGAGALVWKAMKGK